MATFDESKLRFDFDAHVWSSLLKIDNSQDHINVQVLPGTKAVDFTGFCNENLVFIEVKNFRNTAGANRYRTVNQGEKLAEEVGLKVRNTLAVLIGGSRNSTNCKVEFTTYSKHMVIGNPIKVILWLEEDNPSSKREKAGLGTYTNKLKSKLKWLTGGGSHVFVIDSTSNNLNGLQVVILPN